LKKKLAGKLFRRERNLTHLTDLGTLIRPHLKRVLFDGWLDLAIPAQPQPFPDTFQIAPLYRERFCVAFPVGHEFQAREMIKTYPWHHARLQKGA